MDNSNYPRNRHSEHLGVNKIGKNIRKSPLLQSNFVDPTRPVSQPQVYNINKNDFRNIVQQLTGSPSHHSQEPLPLPRPPVNKSPSMRLQRIRPPPLSPININRPRMPVQLPLNDNNQFGQPPQRTMVPQPHSGWSKSNTAESPISAYMRYLQHSINDPGNPQAQSAGLLPNPHVPPRTNGPPPLLPSPNSQFLLPSPSGYLNLSSPRSPYPLLSPGYQHPPPLTPNFPFSPGILGPGPQPPRSPGISFPLSPGFFPVLSPRWRD
ncbi:hypothetical protein L1987_17433 [Smallanthus sonchifolius]|uniref:Uncharacterized protein n=1 Tax=Smallanthus sonchifolius TaxID=185202 RepID=A0ACB9IXX9_9ASTR|nr:hypothetical protein L1987_17433 [Smallanthus sonchifolius]